MGEIVDVEFTRGRPPKYNWPLWADGKKRRLYQGTDFDASLTSFRTMVHRKARDLGLRAHTKINEADASMTVQFFTEN